MVTITEIKETLRSPNPELVALATRIEDEGVALTFDEGDREAHRVMADLHSACVRSALDTLNKMSAEFARG